MLKGLAIALMASSVSLLMVDDASAFGRHRNRGHRGHRGNACHQPAVIYAARPAVSYGYPQAFNRSPVSAYRYPYGGAAYSGWGYGGAGYGRTGYYGAYGGRGYVTPYSSSYRGGLYPGGRGYGFGNSYFGPSVGVPGTGLRLGF